MKYVGKKLGTMCITLLLVSFLVFLCFSVIPGDPALAKLGTEGVRDLLALQRADRIGTGTGDVSVFDPVEALIQELLAENACFSLKELAINGHDLMELGFSGKAIGNCLSSLLELVLDERIPNETAALLREAESYSKTP